MKKIQLKIGSTYATLDKVYRAGTTYAVTDDIAKRLLAARNEDGLKYFSEVKADGTLKEPAAALVEEPQSPATYIKLDPNAADDEDDADLLRALDEAQKAGGGDGSEEVESEQGNGDGGDAGTDEAVEV